VIDLLESTDSATAPLLFGFAPPKLANDEGKTHRITERRLERVAEMELDALILYDVQDESDRTETDRPFPYLPAIDPLRYLRDYLDGPAIRRLPVVVYRAVAGHTHDEMIAFLGELAPDREAAVLVGAPSRDSRRRTTLRQAYALRREHAPRLSLGGVAIPERHAEKGDEHLRLAGKRSQGCAFFVSQCVYDAEAARNLLSDHSYHARDAGAAPARVILTFSPCGSMQTLAFMEWLGVTVPRWLKNDLARSEDILAQSVTACTRIAGELAEFCVERSIPFGFNVESVSIRRREIDAAGRIVADLAALLRRFGLR
jgi:hypothetical protein